MVYWIQHIQEKIFIALQQQVSWNTALEFHAEEDSIYFIFKNYEKRVFMSAKKLSNTREEPEKFTRLHKFQVVRK